MDMFTHKHTNMPARVLFVILRDYLNLTCEFKLPISYEVLRRALSHEYRSMRRSETKKILKKKEKNRNENKFSDKVTRACSRQGRIALLPQATIIS